MVKIDDYKNDVPVQWCPGCPNFSILSALKAALTTLENHPHACCLVSGIGHAAKLPHYLKCNFFNGLHGRALPAALGVHVANRALEHTGHRHVHDCTFMARGFAADGDHLKSLLVEAIGHPGLSIVEVIQPCITWGTHPTSWYRERVYTLSDDYDPADRKATLEKTMETEEKIAIGILFRAAQTFRRPVPERDYRQALCGNQTGFSGKN